MSLIGRLDQIANTGGTPWHRASALAKMVLAALLLGLVVAARPPATMAAMHATAWALVLTSRIPARIVLGAATYPLFFSLVFLVSTWNGRLSDLIWMLRPVTASLIAVWLVATTPYPDLFAPVSRILPRAVGDGLFVTYRGVFDLLGRAERMWRALRVRGGTRGSPMRQWTVAGEGLGTLVLYGVERGQRLYATMLLRGYSGRICGCRHWLEWAREDALVVGVALMILGLAMRFGV